MIKISNFSKGNSQLKYEICFFLELSLFQLNPKQQYQNLRLQQTTDKYNQHDSDLISYIKYEKSNTSNNKN